MTGQPLGGAGLVIASAAELTALTPTDGQIIAFQDPTTLVDGTSTMRQLGVRWLFQYDGRSVSGSKWEYVGGPPLFAAVDTDESTVSAAYADLTTPGPTLTNPLAGDYIVEFVAETYNTAIAANFMSPNGVTGDEAVISLEVAAQNTHLSHRRLLKTGMSASTALKLQYKRSAGTGNWRKRTISLLPVRVG